MPPKALAVLVVGTNKGDSVVVTSAKGGEEVKMRGRVGNKMVVTDDGGRVEKVATSSSSSSSSAASTLSSSTGSTGAAVDETT